MLQNNHRKPLLLVFIIVPFIFWLIGTIIQPQANINPDTAPTPTPARDQAQAQLSRPSSTNTRTTALLTSTPTPTPTSTPTVARIFPTPTPTLARRASLGMPAEKIVPTSFLPGHGPEIAGELVYTGRWIDIYAGSNTFSHEQIAEMGGQAEESLVYMQRRFDEWLTDRVSVGVYHPVNAPSSDTRGIAYTDSDVLFIYYAADEDLHNAVVILSHELAHQLQADAYGDDAQCRADIVLLEGLATWISGEYWLSLSDSTSWEEHSRELMAAGHGAHVLANGETFAYAASYTNSDTAYELWAGFVQYLATTYGWDSFNALYVSGCGREPGTADYEGIYGKSFDELTSEWRATMEEE